MIDHPLDERDLRALSARERRQRRFRRVGLLLLLPLAVLLVGCPLAIPVSNMMDRMAEQRRERRLLALPYPEQRRYDHPYAVSEQRFYPPASQRELARIRLQAPLVRNGEELASATLWLEVLAGRPADELDKPIASVSITIVAHVPPQLPTFEDPLPSLELIADGRTLAYRLWPDDVGMQIARQRAARAPGSSEVGLSIPTEDFLAIAHARQAEGRIGAVRFVVPPETREALLDFASRLRPVAR